MNIGSPNGLPSADALATGMAERVRNAHDTAQVQSEAGEVEASPPPSREPDEVDTVGAQLRIELEEIVAEVLSGDQMAPDKLLDSVIGVVVDDRLERSGLGADEGYRDELAEQLRDDPNVVAEVDELLQTIARDLALR